MTREEALAALTARPVPFKEEGLDVCLRPLRAGEVQEAKEFDKTHPGGFYQFLFVRSVCDADGTRLFADADAAMVADFPAAAVEAVTGRVLKLNRMDKDPDPGKAPSPATPN